MFSSGLDQIFLEHSPAHQQVPQFTQSGDETWWGMLDPWGSLGDVGSLRNVGYLNSNPCNYIRAGLRVCPERNDLHLKEAHFTAPAQCFMTLVHLWETMFHVEFLGRYVGKVNPLRTSCVSAFPGFFF